MNKKRIIKILGLYFLFFFLGTGFFILLFHTGVLANISVFFYRGVSLLVLSSLSITLILLYFRTTKYGKLLSIKDIILLITLIFCLNLVFFTHFPVTADRSISVFLLGYMNKYQDRYLTNKDITGEFINKYVIQNDAINKRLNEQIVSGNIVQNGYSYRISKQGKLLTKLYAFIADIFNVNKKLILP